MHQRRKVEAHGWTVSPDVVLKRATFHKEAMYADLLANMATITQHEIIGALSNTSGEEPLETDLPLPDESMMDELAPPEKAHLILDADASQRAAIHAAVLGHSFVMDGPPGTGKSQTIANMIAELISAGKTVLFVSEKAAALDVVFNRLFERGLEDFLFQLHSHKATRKEVVANLNRSLVSSPKAASHMSEADISRLLRARRELTQYAQAVNEHRSPLGKPLIDVLGRLSQLNRHRTPPPPQIRDPLANLSAAGLADHLDDFEDLARVWRPAIEPDFAWRGLANTAITAAERAQITQDLEHWGDGLQQLEELANQLAIDLRLPAVAGRRPSPPCSWPPGFASTPSWTEDWWVAGCRSGR